MPKQDKTPKKKPKKKSPQKSGETEYPAMDQEEYNRLLQNAIEQIKAEAEQKFEERLKAVEADREAQIKVAEDRLTKKFDDEVREVRQAFEESRGANPTTRDTTLMRGLGIMTEAVVANTLLLYITLQHTLASRYGNVSPCIYTVTSSCV